MTRSQIVLLLSIGVPLLFPGVPILVFLLSYPHLGAWDARTWVIVLVPNLLLLVIVGSVVAGAYLLATRRG